MNTIIIRNEEELKEVLKTNSSIFFKDFIFKEYRLKVNFLDSTWVLNVTSYGFKHHVKARLIKGYDSKEIIFDYLSDEEKVEVLSNPLPTGSLVDYGIDTLDNNDYIINAIKLCISLNERTREYIMSKSFERTTVVKNKKINKNRTTSKRNNKSKKDDTIFLLNDIIAYTCANETGIKHNITCDCWTVRGHYRHYKSGKVIFIGDYRKGKNKNIPVNKTYIL